MMIEPCYPFERCQFDGLPQFPCGRADESIQPCTKDVDVLASALSWLPTDGSMPDSTGLSLSRMLTFRNSVGVMDKGSDIARAMRIKRLFKCIQNEVRGHRQTDASADKALGEHGDHERHVQPTLPRRSGGEIQNQELVEPVSLELTVDPREARHREWSCELRLTRITLRYPCCFIKRSSVQACSALP
jgi:hypothetical protein